MDRSRCSKYLPSLDLRSLYTAKRRSDVVSRLCLIQQLAEHLYSRYDYLPLLICQSYDLYLVGYLEVPLSTLPVATVPRPVMENTSSTGIRNGFPVALTGSGM